eukprot:Gb_06396 [translate_table: standard]
MEASSQLVPLRMPQRHFRCGHLNQQQKHPSPWRSKLLLHPQIEILIDLGNQQICLHNFQT